MEKIELGARFLALTLFLLLAGALWGWGLVVRRLFRETHDVYREAPLTIVHGLALVLFAGGFLNLLHVALAGVLDAIVVAGGILAVVLGWREKRAAPEFPRGRAMLGWIPVVVAGLFVFCTEFPERAFNFHDDFEKYFAHPVRMLATGSIGGNPLSSVGSETLGGQAFLQGFVAAHLPLPYLASLDRFFGFLLCLALVRPTGAKVWLGFLSQAALIVVNPQIVNVSALYLGVALSLAVVRGAGTTAKPASLGLMGAGLLALKTTFGAFVLGFLPALLAVEFLTQGRRAISWRFAFSTAAWTALFLLPWVILHAPLYLHPADRPANSVLPEGPVTTFSPFSLDAWGYGSPVACFTFLAVGLLLLGVLAPRDRPTDSAGRPASGSVTAAALFTGAISYFIFTLFLARWTGEGAMRYATPVMLGCLTGALGLMADARTATSRRWRALDYGSVAVLVLALASFLPSLPARIQQIAAIGSPLAFSSLATDPGYLAYNQYALSAQRHERLQQIQAKVPAGEMLVAWVTTSFWFDFKRNQIHETNPAGLGARWAIVPSSRYYVWEYQGFGVRSPDETRIMLEEGCPIDRWDTLCSLTFRKSLVNAAASSEILYDDGEIMLFRLRN